LTASEGDESMKVYPLLVGEFEARDSTTFRGGNPELIVWYSSYIFYIEGAGSRIVVDTGFTDPEVCLRRMNHRCRRPPGASVVERLAALKVTPEEVDTVVLTHCHWDHIGGLSLFPRARVYCQRGEVAWSVSPPEWIGAAYPRALADSLPSVGGRLTVLDGDFVLEQGIRLIHVGAHSPGSQMMEVQCGDRTVIITGDALLHYANLEKQIPIGTYHSLEQAMAALSILNRFVLNDPKTVLLASHDPRVWEQYRNGV
jgi:glyoxylase-like metal-dependent hydrolase (beta-lactamase superfamily II)